MTDKERNPYVILGVDYGVDLREARRGFVRAVRRARAEPEGAFKEEHVTEALHEVEQVLLSPGASIDVYRIPADPTPYALRPGGIFDPAPTRLPRRSPALDREELDRLFCDAMARRVKALAESADFDNVRIFEQGGVDG